MTEGLNDSTVSPTEIIEELTFYVEGNPAPQGSKKHVGNGIMVEASKALPAWRKAVTDAAVEALAGRTGFIHKEAVHCSMRFFMNRGKTVKRDLPTVTPDLDKLERAVNDALTKAGVWGDDAQVTNATHSKQYAPELTSPGVQVTVRRTA